MGAKAKQWFMLVWPMFRAFSMDGFAAGQAPKFCDFIGGGSLDGEPGFLVIRAGLSPDSLRG